MKGKSFGFQTIYANDTSTVYYCEFKLILSMHFVNSLAFQLMYCKHEIAGCS